MSKRGVQEEIVGIAGSIKVVRGRRVILDNDLAKIYGVRTKALNQAVKRNAQKFPGDFMFRLTREEADTLMSQFATSRFNKGNRSQFVTGSQKHRDPRFLPNAFTDYGAIMAANVLNSRRAVMMSVFVVRAFVKIRETLLMSKTLHEKLVELERKLTSRLDVHEKAIVHILNEIKKLMTPPTLPVPKKRPIGFGREE